MCSRSITIFYDRNLFELKHEKFDIGPDKCIRTLSIQTIKASVQENSRAFNVFDTLINIGLVLSNFQCNSCSKLTAARGTTKSPPNRRKLLANILLPTETI